MNGIYQVTVRGRKLESRDLRKLLARAVAEKRGMDHRLRLFASLQRRATTYEATSVSCSLLSEDSSGC